MIKTLAIGTNEICSLQPGKTYTARVSVLGPQTASIQPLEKGDNTTEHYNPFTENAGDIGGVAISGILWEFDVADGVTSSAGFTFTATLPRFFLYCNTANTEVLVEVVPHE